METITTIINWFGLIYVGIPIVSLISLIIYFLTGGRISNKNLDKIIQFSKWYIVSVAIVFSAKIVESSFTERETGIKEMQVYDKYVETILEADNIESRWKLAEYFSTVTPTERLRERWLAYKSIIEVDYNKFKELEAKENELLSKDSLTEGQKNILNSVQLEKASFERKLVDVKTGKWAVVFTADTDLEQSKWEQNLLIKAGIEHPKIYLKSNFYQTVSKTFSSRQDALDYLQSHKTKIRNDAYVVNLEDWCPGGVAKDDYFECR